MSDSRDHLAIYSKLCLNCSHFVDIGEKTYTKCHFSKGNKDCPADPLEGVKIVVVGKAKSLALKVKQARAERNTSAEARILTAVAGMTEAFREKFYSELER